MTTAAIIIFADSGLPTAKRIATATGGEIFTCGQGGADALRLLPRLFAHSLREVEPKLGACLEIAEWKGGHRELEDALFGEADCLTATGSDETLDEIRRRTPAGTRFLGYGHRVSFAYVAQDALLSLIHI